MKILNLIIILSVVQMSFGQDKQIEQLPYEQIPEYPSDFTSGNVISRFIDGLGFRYYWATEGLTEKELNYKPTNQSRAVIHTLQHIYEMSIAIANAPQNIPNISGQGAKDLSYQELRKHTLLNFKKASELILGSSAEEVDKFSVIFQNGDNKRAFPYWHMMNGQIADCIYHVGQIVSFRRSSGNPLNPKVNVFMGKTGR